MISLINIILS